MTIIGPSGQLRLRMPPSLHDHLAVGAANEGVSLNQWIVTLLAGGSAFHVKPDSGEVRGQDASQLQTLADEMFATKKIDPRANRSATMSALASRPIPAGLESAAALEHVARTLRTDSRAARTDRDFAESKRLSRRARMVEYVHEAYTGKQRTGPMASFGDDAC